MNKEKKSRLAQLSELPFLILFAVYLTGILFMSSTFGLPFPQGFEKKMFFLLCASLVFRIPALLKTKKMILAAAVLLALNYALVYRSVHYPFLLLFGILTFGFTGIDHRKVMKLFTLCLGFFLVMTFSAACCGAIQDFVYMKDGHVRSALGTGYPTDMASYVLFLLMYTWAAWRRIPDLTAAVLGVVGIFFSRYIAMSITGTICSTVFCIMVLGHFLCIECGLLKKTPKFLKDLVRQLMTFAFPLLGLLMFALIFAYAKNIGPALRLNNILSERLSLPLEAYRTYGLNAFGAPLPQDGNGFSSFSPNKYNFVDSTYPLILLRYGWVLFLALCAVWVSLTKKAIKNGDTRLACLLALIAVHAFSEHHFIESNFNVLVLLPFAVYQPIPASEEVPVRGKIYQNVKACCILAAAACFAAAVLPRFFTWMRTVIQLQGWTGGGNKGVLVLRYLTRIYAFGFLFLAAIFFLVKWFLPGHPKIKKGIILSALFTAAITFAGLSSVIRTGNDLIDTSAPKCSRQIQADQDALRIITKFASGKVYINSIPAIYQKTFPKISNSLLQGEELARFYNTSVILEKSCDSPCFINSGFLFTPISARHALYTNDAAVISALKEKGYHLTGYYNVRKSVNLRSVGRINQLSYKEGDGLRLSGNDYALNKGPFVSLYSGPYTAEYELQLLEDTNTSSDINETDAVATLRVSAYSGEKILKEHILRRNEFDEHGHAEIQVPFTSGSYSGIEFLIFPDKNQELSVLSITYYRSPQYDVHSLYNKKRQKYREEYYTLEGAPATTSMGYNACEYEYNYDGKITEIRYYDSSNNPVLLNNGYASLKRKLDQKGRTILESYFDTKGNLTLCSNGYSSVSREYDLNNNVTIEKYFDINGNPTATTSIYAEIHRVFNDLHQIIKESYYDSEGNPLMMPSGYAAIESQYDSSGRPYIQKYLDINGKPVITINQYAEIHREYTPQNLVSQESYFDTEGFPITLSAGYSMIKRSYDDNGNAILTEYCNPEGKRVMTTMHYAALQRKFNERNHVIYDAYLGVDNEPLLMPENYASVSYERNEIGDAISFKYYDQDGNLTLRSDGYAEIKRDYNNLRLPCRDIYLDTNGDPIITAMNYAEIRRTFNSLRQISREYYYDTKGNAIALPSGQASVSYERDDSGLPIIIRYYNLDDEPMLISSGYAEMHRSYNKLRQIISESYYDVNHNPVNNTSNYHKVEYERDNSNRITHYRYYDIELKPLLWDWGYYEHQIIYNSNGSIASHKYFDPGGKELFPPKDK